MWWREQHWPFCAVCFRNWREIYQTFRVIKWNVTTIVNFNVRISRCTQFRSLSVDMGTFGHKNSFFTLLLDIKNKMYETHHMRISQKLMVRFRVYLFFFHNMKCSHRKTFLQSGLTRPICPFMATKQNKIRFNSISLRKKKKNEILYGYQKMISLYPRTLRGSSSIEGQTSTVERKQLNSMPTTQ